MVDICQVRSKGTQVPCPGGFALLPKAAEEEEMSESTQGTRCDRQKPWPRLTRYIFLVSGLDWALQPSSSLLLPGSSGKSTPSFSTQSHFTQLPGADLSREQLFAERVSQSCQSPMHPLPRLTPPWVLQWAFCPPSLPSPKRQVDPPWKSPCPSAGTLG